jgi:hypothetical protein
MEGTTPFFTIDSNRENVNRETQLHHHHGRTAGRYSATSRESRSRILYQKHNKAPKRTHIETRALDPMHESKDILMLSCNSYPLSCSYAFEAFFKLIKVRVTNAHNHYHCE